jgi:hypothetical protein
MWGEPWEPVSACRGSGAWRSRSPRMGFEHAVARVIEVHFGVWIIASKGLGAGRPVRWVMRSYANEDDVNGHMFLRVPAYGDVLVWVR